MSSINGEVHTYKFENNQNKIMFIDENDFNKKIRAIRRYSMNAYKYWHFEALPILKKDNKKDGVYELELPVNELFKKVYGDVKVLFSVKNGVVVLENITPSEMLIDMFMGDLPTYKGIPYRDSKDKFKIDLMKEIKNEK